MASEVDGLKARVADLGELIPAFEEFQTRVVEIEDGVDGYRIATKKEIEDLFKIVFDNRQSILQKSNMTGDINDNVLQLLNEMERDVVRKQDSAEADKLHKILV